MWWDIYTIIQIKDAPACTSSLPSCRHLPVLAHLHATWWPTSVEIPIAAYRARVCRRSSLVLEGIRRSVSRMLLCVQISRNLNSYSMACGREARPILLTTPNHLLLSAVRNMRRGKSLPLVICLYPSMRSALHLQPSNNIWDQQARELGFNTQEPTERSGQRGKPLWHHHHIPKDHLVESVAGPRTGHNL
jgi:hypothetical protein